METVTVAGIVVKTDTGVGTETVAEIVVGTATGVGTVTVAGIVVKTDTDVGTGTVAGISFDVGADAVDSVSLIGRGVVFTEKNMPQVRSAVVATCFRV